MQGYLLVFLRTWAAVLQTVLPRELAVAACFAPIVAEFMEEPARDMGNKALVKSKSEKPASLSRLASSIRFLAIRSSRSCL